MTLLTKVARAMASRIMGPTTTVLVPLVHTVVKINVQNYLIYVTLFMNVLAT